MPTGNSTLIELEQLQSNQILLQIQLKDLNELIDTREEELALLRIKANEAVRIKIVLDNAITEIELLQESIEEEKKDSYEGLQMINLEKELLVALKENHLYEDQLRQQQSLKANLQQVEDELATTMDYYAKIRTLKEALSISQSNLELAELDMEDMKTLVAQLEQQNLLLKQKCGDS